MATKADRNPDELVPVLSIQARMRLLGGHHLAPHRGDPAVVSWQAVNIGLRQASLRAWRMQTAPN
jgi:hypothetical protein